MLYAGNETNIISSVMLQLRDIIHSEPQSPRHSSFVCVLICIGRANSHQGFSAVMLSAYWAR